MHEGDFQHISILKGKRIKLTLKASSYFGVIQRINPNKTLILSDVVGVGNGRKYPGSKMFFGYEVLNVEFSNEANNDIGNVRDHRARNHLSMERSHPYRKAVTMGHDEDEEEYVDFVVVDEFQGNFGSAVMHIKKQHVIGVGAEGVEVFKHGRLCWLQIATKNKVYLFDILLLGARAFKNGLSMILENKHILKVIHDCRAIAGCLITQFGVKLTNVFDTQVADVMCFYSDTGGSLPDRVSNLKEVVSLHLKVPSSQLLLLQMKSQLTEEEKELWYKRPCPITLLKGMALSVIHLQPLRLVLLDTLMTDYMALVDSYLNSCYCEPDALEHVSMGITLELPRELRQLQQMHQERQKWAANHYPVTEQGLLARFSPQAKSQASTAAEEDSETQADSFRPATVESPSSAQLDSLLHQPPTSPPRVTSVSWRDPASPDPPAQTPIADLGKQTPPVSPLPVGEGRGHRESPMDTIGRGRLFGKEQSSLYALSAIGRGFRLRIPPTQIPRERAGDRMETRSSQKAAPQPYTDFTDLPKDTSG